MVHVSKWRSTNPERDLDESQKRLLLSKVVKVAIVSVFKNHLYMFNGETYLQLAGGPIGLRLTSIVARVVMDDWMKGFLVRLDDAGMKLWMVAKYVDDVNVVCDVVSPGWMWLEGSLQWKEDWERQDKSSGVSPEVRTANIILEAAEMQVQWLKFTYDLPELYENGKVPMLDVEMWVDKTQEESDVLMWNFFEKSSSSSRVLQATSAYGWRSKLVVMNMEMFRRQRNTCRQVTVKQRVAIMNEFVKKLRISGYSSGTDSRIIKEGTKLYYRKLRADLERGPPLNQRSEEDLVMGRRQKISAAESWYARKRGGANERWSKDHGWKSKLGGSGGSDPLGSGGEVGPSWSDPPRRRRKSKPSTTTCEQENDKQQEEKVPEKTLLGGSGGLTFWGLEKR